ncbi:MAG: type I-E CRISPR-associated protein Cas7/Cse4/CasC [Desulfomonile sp.]
MLIEIHVIQNHSPANLNRDDLGAPKTCYFGGVLRSRISSQCIKRSIRMSGEFKKLCGGIRTRQLAKLIAEQVTGKSEVKKRAETILALCGFKQKKTNKKNPEEDGMENGDKSKMLVYTTREAVKEMATLLQNDERKSDEQLAKEFGTLISKRVAVPDMALSGRMLETGVLKDTTVDAALQVAHAISTHEARPEVDYYVAADDIPGEDAGAGYVDEAMFASACYYKYFSIHWETLVKNLEGFQGNKEHLAAHTVGAFIRGAALVNPSGKQNSYAAHNPPDGMLIEIKDAPISYANAFARPAVQGERDIISQSIAQLGQYIRDLDTGYGKPQKRFWFSPNLRYSLSVIENKQEIILAENNFKSLDELITKVVAAIGHDWAAVQRVMISRESAL